MTTLTESRVWFVTGSSSGIGKALVSAVLAANERVVAAARNTSALADLQSKYSPDQLVVLPLDVTDTTQIAEAFTMIEQKFHRLDVVVNGAGYAVLGEIEGIPEETARKQVEVLFWGPVHITKEAIRFFREVNSKGHGGFVVNISSYGGYVGQAGAAFYSAGKFALEGFTEAFVREMPPEWNIRGIIIEPGNFKTAFLQNLDVVPPHPAYDATSPAGRVRQAIGAGAVPLPGDVDKFARAVLQVVAAPNRARLPLRLPLGPDASLFISSQARRTAKDVEEWAELSQGTDSDDSVGSEYMQMLRQMLGETP